MLVIFYLSHVALVKVLRHFAKISQTLSEFKSANVDRDLDRAVVVGGRLSGSSAG